MTRLTIERLFSSPSLNGPAPQQVRFSPDGSTIAYLVSPVEDRQRLDLFLYDIAASTTRCLVNSASVVGAGSLSEVEKAARERRRAFEGGVSQYRWLPDSSGIVCAIDGAVYVCLAADEALQRVTPDSTRQTDLEVSGSGRYLSYVRDKNLFLFDRTTSRERQLTHDADPHLSNGLADFIAQEEMHRFEGHWWSADDRYLVFTRVDIHAIAETQRLEFGATELVVHAQRYPYAGTANALVQLGVVDLQTNDVQWLAWSDHPDDYLARVNVHRGVAYVQVQRRDQRRLTLKALPMSGGPPIMVLQEDQPAWINLHNNLRFIGNSSDFVWTSERDGAARAYLHRADAIVALGDGRGRVNEVVHADATQVYLLAWREAPTEQHLYRIRFDAPHSMQCLTAIPGWHDGAIDPTGSWFADRFSNLQQPPGIILRSLIEEADQRPLAANTLTEGHPYFSYSADHSTADIGCLAASDGQPLWYRLTLPRQFDAARRWPVVISVYGGPGVQRVRNEWAPLTLQLFADAGIAVFELDNRGTGNRAKGFEDPIAGCLGRVEVEDQLAGLAFLREQPWVDAARIGVMGHSYGGFMTLMLMAHARGAIRAGISGAPVTDWRLYDTHYTERYLGLPSENQDGYRNSSVFAHLHDLSGALLLIHGMADDNVLVSNSTKLIDALQRQRTQFEMMFYPGAKHALHEPSVAVHRHATMLDFFGRRLLS